MKHGLDKMHIISTTKTNPTQLVLKWVDGIKVHEFQ